MRKLTLALASTLFLSSCQPAQRTVPESSKDTSSSHAIKIGTRGGTIVLSSWGGPKTFNPIVGNESSSSEFAEYIFAGLTKIDAHTGLPEPLLAQSWTVDSSGRIYTFKLRPALAFNDGSPLRASDVEFTWNRLAFDTAILCAMRDILMVDGKLPQVKALDSLTVEFRLPTVFGPFLSAAGGLPILSEKRLKNKTGVGFNSVYGIDTPPDSLIGAGPFRLVRYEPGSRGIYVPNPHWYKKDSAGNQLPYLDTILLTIVQDQSADVLKFKAGETDAIEVKAQDFPVLKPLEAEGNFTIHKLGPSFDKLFLAFNQNTQKDKKGKPYVDPVKLSWFTDARFRRAISWAIDRKTIRDIVWNGLGGDANGPLSPSDKYWWNASLPPLRKDSDSAKAQLAEAGFKKGPDGKLRDAKGNQVKFTLLTNTENKMRIDMAGLIRKDLEALGIEVVFVQVEFNALVSRIDATFDWDAILLGLTGGGDPHFGANVWNSSGRTHMWFPKQKKPATAWEATLDSLVIAGVTSADTAARKRTYDQLQAVVRREQPYIYVGHPEKMYALRNRFGNIDPTVLGGILHNIDEIYVLK